MILFPEGGACDCQNDRRTIGIGIARAGFIGPAHLDALRRNNLHVVGLSEVTAERAAQKAVELGIPKAYASFDEMLADADVDVVHIATPNRPHHAQANSALLAGKHVVCEKTTGHECSGIGRAGGDRRPHWAGERD